MTFEEAARQYTFLRQQHDAGQLPEDQYRAAVAQMVVADQQGNYWMLDPDSAQWVPYAAPSPPPPAVPAPEPKRRGLPQSTWDIISVVGNALLSAGWYLYSGMAETKPDYLTCGAMLVLPISFVVFRKPLDGLLRSIQPFRSKIPPMVLAGCCVAVPYLISNYLFAFGVRQFTFMFCSYVLSTVVSFVLMRQPSGGGASSTMPPGVTQRAGAI
jgi:hypothetical protein